MNYAQKELLQALKALKQAAKRRHAADAVAKENPVQLTLTAASGLTVALPLPLADAACRGLAVNAADEVISEALRQESAADKHVAYWAREVALLASQDPKW